MDLRSKKCIPCEAGTPPLTKYKISKFAQQLKSDWEIEDKKIARTFKLKNFKQAIEFVNKVADIAENEGHHPNIFIMYNKVKIVLTTHAIAGLSENDFILASKIEHLKS